MGDSIMAALIGFVGVVAGAVLSWWFGRKQQKADIASTLTDAAVKLIDPLKEEICELREHDKRQDRKISRFLKRIEYLMAGIRTLIGQLEQAKIPPLWQPDDWDPEKEDGGDAN